MIESTVAPQTQEATAAIVQSVPGSRRSQRPPPPIEHEMSGLRKSANLIGVLLPFIGLIAAIVLLWHQAVGPLELGLMATFYVITCLGVTLGYHRMFTHRALEASR